ncbi:unnamed protein product [Timema podura]|uniref:Uncharacterized protein n=1 Tax=Timema podura TaxID=61482 RepID=A0ABN7NNI6_TIMPD|nr:unnamed protein product [Timema podura]
MKLGIRRKGGVVGWLLLPPYRTLLIDWGVERGVTRGWKNSCEFGSQKYFILCGLGGILSCGITHTLVVPLDLVKCRIQVNPEKYKSVFNGFKVTIKEDGTKGLAKGWAPTFFGYSMQFPTAIFGTGGPRLKLLANSWLQRDTNISAFACKVSEKGLCKFGLYEVFKVFYSDILGEENSYLWRTSLYLAASASAEFFADIALSPMEAAKVK